MGIIKERPVPPFYAVDQMLSLFLAALMGLQHALAMIGALTSSERAVKAASCHALCC